MTYYTIGNRVAHIRGLIVLADENIHIADRHVDDVAARFWKHFRRVLTSAASVPIACHVVATKCPILPLDLVFEHEGQYLPYTKARKDLAIIKYCSSGVRDDRGGFYHVLKCLRQIAKPSQGRPGDISFENWLVVFITTDFGSGMKNALAWLESCSCSLSWVLPIQVPKSSTKSRAWINVAAESLALEINRRFSHCTLDGWGLAIPSATFESIGSV